ncbi:hypothetical protein QJS10_CPB20g00039 [Acorus calamus]|uniref:Cytochrome P450 n=1 Tax=Acorus calamus TaxID=4465 RepID=A0AAV9CER5_ACOCL|nr:hypothetical protein QJS10_CPB20g00039 [Acorus calamus]
MALHMLLLFLFSIGFGGLALYVYEILWLRPEKMRAELRSQGINGPPPHSFLRGNVPEMERIESEERSRRRGGDFEAHTQGYDGILFPYFDRWRKIYGPTYMYSVGNLVSLYVAEPGLVKDISLYVSQDLGKPSYLQKAHEPLFGNGILKANGPAWAHQRRIISPEFYMDKVKGMMGLIVDSTISMLKAWESRIDESGCGKAEVRVDGDLRDLSADVISRACFGDSYSKGEEIFSMLAELKKAMSKQSLIVGIPDLRFLPTKKNRETWRLVKEIRWSVLSMVRERRGSSSSSSSSSWSDLLQSLLSSADVNYGSPSETDRFLVDNCKNIYFAGHETTAVTATWAMMLLASHPDWQAKARAEVIRVCGDRPPDHHHMLRKMKTLTMVIQETLRLYSPSAFVAREALRDLKLGELRVPKGVNILIPISTMHCDKDVWGPDADAFDPARFARGVSGACRLPHAYMPFGTGTRTCLGQNLAMVELKVVLSMVLSRFNFSLSPSYWHSPAFKLTVETEFGLPLTMTKV